MVPQDKPQNADPSGPLEELLCLGWKKLLFYSPAKGRKDLYHARIFSGGGVKWPTLDFLICDQSWRLICAQ